MRTLKVYRNEVLAGTLTENDAGHYIFEYEDWYFFDPKQPAISVTLPKKRQKYESPYLFPFFHNMLSEGSNRRLQERILKIDETDSFGLLAETAQYDTIGAVTIHPIEGRN